MNDGDHLGIATDLARTATAAPPPRLSPVPSGPTAGSRARTAHVLTPTRAPGPRVHWSRRNLRTPEQTPRTQKLRRPCLHQTPTLTQTPTPTHHPTHTLTHTLARSLARFPGPDHARAPDPGPGDSPEELWNT